MLCTAQETQSRRPGGAGRGLPRRAPHLEARAAFL